MKGIYRSQILLKETQYKTLKEMSRNLGKSISAIVRDWIDEKLIKIRVKGHDDPLFSIKGIGKGDGTDIGKEHDKYLYGAK